MLFAINVVIIRFPPDWIRTVAIRNSFQLNMNAKIAVATTPGAVNGRTILNSAPTREHPSINEASSSSGLMDSKAARRFQIQKGKLIAAFTRTSAQMVSMSGVPVIIVKIAMLNTIGGNDLRMSKLPIIWPRPRNLNLVNPYAAKLPKVMERKAARKAMRALLARNFHALVVVIKLIRFVNVMRSGIIPVEKGWLGGRREINTIHAYGESHRTTTMMMTR